MREKKTLSSIFLSYHRSVNIDVLAGVSNPFFPTVLLKYIYIKLVYYLICIMEDHTTESILKDNYTN